MAHIAVVKTEHAPPCHRSEDASEDSHGKHFNAFEKNTDRPMRSHCIEKWTPVAATTAKASS